MDPFVYSQWLLKILNNAYQFWQVENVVLVRKNKALNSV